MPTVAIEVDDLGALLVRALTDGLALGHPPYVAAHVLRTHWHALGGTRVLLHRVVTRAIDSLAARGTRQAPDATLVAFWCDLRDFVESQPNS